MIQKSTLTLTNAFGNTDENENDERLTHPGGHIKQLRREARWQRPEERRCDEYPLAAVIVRQVAADYLRRCVTPKEARQDCSLKLSDYYQRNLSQLYSPI